jgi:tRNA pseudouridine55 synthase
VVNGVFLINKKKFFTSSKILAVFKNRTNIKKAGIFGILDPLATGILPIVVGEATKFINYIPSNNKTYEVKCKLGVFSECGDYETEPITFENEIEIVNNLSIEVINNTFKKFLGKYPQMPPMFSASKHKGKPLYRYARENIIVKRELKERYIFDLKFVSLVEDVLTLKVTCSPGTYIRTLVQDISKHWNIHSCLFELNRSIVEPFEKYSAIDLNDINKDNLDKYNISISDMLKNIACINCNSREINKLYTGLSIERQNSANESICKLMDEENNFHGIGYFKENVLYPKRLMKR